MEQEEFPTFKLLSKQSPANALYFLLQALCMLSEQVRKRKDLLALIAEFHRQNFAFLKQLQSDLLQFILCFFIKGFATEITMKE